MTALHNNLKPAGLTAQNFVYERIDGLPIYYNNYKNAIKNHQNPDSIMGASLFQIFLIKIISKFLDTTLNPKEFIILNGELGLHISKNQNFSADITIYNRKLIQSALTQTTYTTIPPKIVIEIDTKADFGNIHPNNYFYKKNKQLLEFGVEKVIWVFTNSRQIQIAVANEDWILRDWSRNVEVMDGISFNLDALLADEDVVWTLE